MTFRRTERQSSLAANATRMAAVRKTIQLLVLLWCPISLVSCTPCADKMKARTLSSDNQLVAHYYERNCGATTDYSSVVNVQSVGDGFDGNAGVLFVVKGRPDISIGWTGPRTLTIKCAACSRGSIFREVSVSGDVNVVYTLAAQVGVKTSKQ